MAKILGAGSLNVPGEIGPRSSVGLRPQQLGTFESANDKRSMPFALFGMGPLPLMVVDEPQLQSGKVDADETRRDMDFRGGVR